MRVVLDANVFISAVISSQGNPAEILRLWERGKFDLVVSAPLLEELERVIHYPRIQKRYNPSEEYVQRFLRLISNMAIIVEPSVELDIVEKDPSDNRYLECALAGGAAYIVTGDTHLLELREYRGIIILDPVGFLAILALEGVR